MSLQDVKEGRGNIKIAVIRLPRISNFTDFDPLLNDGINVRYVEEPKELKSVDAIIVPGTKNTIGDLEWLRKKGFEESIRALYGKVPIIGICGGYQMLGNGITDGSKKVKGLGLLDMETRFEGYEKTTRRMSGKVAATSGMFEGMHGTEIYGYEIHMGETVTGDDVTAAFEMEDGPEGAIDADGTVFGTYLHGVFDSSSFREGLLRYLGSDAGAGSKEPEEIWNESIEEAARVVSNSLDITRLEEELYA
jgi:adenosylcobyric acid synthase